MNLELYYYDQCPYCQKVLRSIDQLDLKSHVTLKNTLTDRENAIFHQKQTGRSTVPCLYIDSKPFFESEDIIVWLKNNKEKLKG